MSEPKTAQQHNALLTGSFQEFPDSSGFLTAPLPPTAEQTSIARFNALADQIRELEKSLKERQDQDREAISSWISLCERELSTKLDSIDCGSAEWLQTRILLDLTNSRLMAIEKAIKPRAVAKKKAAPLVGEKGTGRKG